MCTRTCYQLHYPRHGQCQLVQEHGGCTVCTIYVQLPELSEDIYQNRIRSESGHTRETYVFSSPTMQMAESSLTTSVIMAD